jgi:hypothetical protein
MVCSVMVLAGLEVNVSMYVKYHIRQVHSHHCSGGSGFQNYVSNRKVNYYNASLQTMWCCGEQLGTLEKTSLKEAVELGALCLRTL